MNRKLRAYLFAVAILSFAWSSLMAQTTKADRPVENFMALWTTFSERYANFELKQVDWDQVYEKYRPLVQEGMTEQEFFTIMCSMIQSLNDGHVTLTADVDSGEIECGPPYTFKLDDAFPDLKAWQAFESTIDATLLQAGFSEAFHQKVSAETNFQYRLSERYAYLRLDEMTEVYTLGRFRKALNRALRAFQSKEALIIDLRFNGGGSDEIGYRLASRLITSSDSLGHFERTRIKGTDQFTKNKYRAIKARGKYRFTGAVVILISDFTASAAEVFLLLMQELPSVTLIGDTTEGIFSDMYEFRLPNGWEASLSHQQFFSRTLINYEGVGIKPDIMAVNSPEDIQLGVDPVIIAALANLKD